MIIPISPFPRRQRGMTLIIGLMMLVSITLLGMSMASLSTSNLQVVRNAQMEQARVAIAQQAVEQVLGGANYFEAPTSPVVVTNTGGLQVSVSDRTCTRYLTASGYSATAGLAPVDTVWSFTVTVSDPTTAASTVVTQGVKMRMLAGSCV
jgi:type II secretory pathway pseudopilin PulG